MNPLIFRRFLALLIDYALILGWGALLFAISFVLFRIWGNGYPDYLSILGPFGTEALFFLLLTAPVGLYFYSMESGPDHATLGKRKCGLRVSNISDMAPSRRQIFVRTAIKLLPWEAAHTLIWQRQYVFYLHGYDAEIPAWIIVGLTATNLLALTYIYC